jgi:hypothetical protein
MIGAQGFRAREAAANYKRRIRKLVPDEVRAARFANLHGLVIETKAPAAPADVPVQPEVAETEETQVEQEAAEIADAADQADTGSDAADGEADKPASKKKAGKAKK